MNESTNKDLILPQGEFAFCQDRTTGIINVLVGPFRSGTSAQETPVILNADGRFKEVSTEASRQQFIAIPDGDYAVLENPAADNTPPPVGKSTPAPRDLRFGRRVNIPGPAHFALWPSQIAKRIPGHVLRSNQYLVVRVVNEQDAKTNWSQAIMKPVVAAPPAGDQKPSEQKLSEAEAAEAAATPPTKDGEKDKPTTAQQFDTTRLAAGALFIIKGTEVSFYIPPTGVEVVRDESGNLVRDALTLERLEFCILLGENGDKEYRRGPDVVFPTPTQSFIENEEGVSKFKAVELNNISGIHIKVIADYKDEVTGVEHKAGEELFITGKNQPIYFPRAEHSIIKYGEQSKSFAVAVPSGEGRYVLDRDTGNVHTIKGPKMLLPDPRREVIVKRILTPKQVQLWFPGNRVALDYNTNLARERDAAGGVQNYLEQERYLSKGANLERGRTRSLAADYDSAPVAAAAAARFGDEVQRGTTYTPPRTITLDNKFEGAVSINVWTGYAVKVTKKTGDSRVVLGPQTAILEYDEELMEMQLSTGKPKTTDKLESTVYLRAENNKVSDVFEVETRDMVPVMLKLSYLVNFEGTSPQEVSRWFAVENYVKLLCDHIRSMLKAASKKFDVAEFVTDATAIIRDLVLGPKPDSVDGQKSAERPGRKFKENNMRIADIEVLLVEIKNPTVASLLTSAQQTAIQQGITSAAAKRELEHAKAVEGYKQDGIAVKAKTAEMLMAEKIAEQVRTQKAEEAERVTVTARLKHNETVEMARLALEQADADQTLQIDTARQELELAMLEKQVAAVVAKAGAMGPAFAEALKAVHDRQSLSAIAAAMSPMAILQGRSVMDVLTGLVRGTGLESVVKGLLEPTAAEVRN